MRDTTVTVDYIFGLCTKSLFKFPEADLITNYFTHSLQERGGGKRRKNFLLQSEFSVLMLCAFLRLAQSQDRADAF